jgi:hypothetical protein
MEVALGSLIVSALSHHVSVRIASEFVPRLGRATLSRSRERDCHSQTLRTPHVCGLKAHRARRAWGDRYFRRPRSRPKPTSALPSKTKLAGSGTGGGGVGGPCSATIAWL